MYNLRNKISPSKKRKKKYLKKKRSIIPVQNWRDIISKPQRTSMPVPYRREVVFPFETAKKYYSHSKPQRNIIPIQNRREIINIRSNN
jgi:hypothetical protein